MSILSTNQPRRSDFIGKRVRSCAVGSKGEFEGTAISYHPGSRLAWVVRDDADGSLWHRTRSELCVIAEAGR